MHYFALLLSPEATSAPIRRRRPRRWRPIRTFHVRAASSIRAGDALTPSATGVRITGGPDAPAVTEGPFAEAAEVAGGYYVFEADDLDEALALARDIPAAKYGAVEVWPMVDWMTPTERRRRQQLAGAAAGAARRRGRRRAPRSGRAGIAKHVEFGNRGRRPTHRRRGVASADHGDDGAGARRQVALTDGPFAEGAEVANGFYLINTADRDEAVKIASMIPATTVELRQLAGISGPVASAE